MPALERAYRPAAYVGLILLVTLRFSFYITDEVLTGWDTLGHLHLARKYAEFFPWGTSGYDSTWFQGFPAFYFYPPFFHFFVNVVSLLPGISFVSAFNLSVLLTILFLAASVMRLGIVVIESTRGAAQALLPALSAAFFYIVFPGEGTQGTSAVGVMSGTIASSLGHAWMLQSLASLMAFRKSGSNTDLFFAAAFFSLLLYTHILSSVFACIVLPLYVFWFRASFRLKQLCIVFGISLFTALPVFARLLINSGYSSGSSYSSFYPPLLSLLGLDFFDAAALRTPRAILIDQLLLEGKALGLLFALFFGWAVGRMLRGRGEQEPAFLTAAALLFIWLASDNSLVFMLPWLPVHWYRTFDFFLAAFSILAAMMIPETGRFYPPLRTAAPALITALLVVRILTWNPAEQQRYFNMTFRTHTDAADLADLEHRLRELPRGSLFLPELIREKTYAGSPHAFLHILESTEHRSLLGLTVESSLTPRIAYARLYAGLSHIFVWGVDHNELHSAMGRSGGRDPALLVQYLRSTGVDYVIGRTPALRAFLDRDPGAFSFVFGTRRAFVYRVLGSSPVASGSENAFAWISADSFHGASRETPSDFLLRAAIVRNAVPSVPLLVRMTGRRLESDGDLSRKFAGFVIYNDPSHPVSIHSVPASLAAGRPVIYVNFPSDGTLSLFLNQTGSGWLVNGRAVLPAPRTDLSLQLTTLSDREISGNAGQHSAIHVRRSFFPDWRGSAGESIFQTELNTMWVHPQRDHFQLLFSDPFSRWSAWILLLFGPAFGFLAFLRFRGR